MELQWHRSRSLRQACDLRERSAAGVSCEVIGSVMRRALNDAAISGLALVVLLLALVSVDDRVRERVGAAPAQRRDLDGDAASTDRVKSPVRLT